MGSFATSTFIAAGKKADITDERLLWATGALVCTLLLGALILALVERWRKRQLSDARTEIDPLTPYREMYRKGELSKDEYERIRQKMADHYRNLTAKPPSDGDAGSENPPPPAAPPEP